MVRARSRFAMRWVAVGVAAAAIVGVGFARGAIWDGVLVAFGDATVFPIPSPMQALRFWVFVGWWAALIVVVGAMATIDRLRASPDRARPWTRRIARGVVVVVSVVATIGTVAFAGLEWKSDEYGKVARKYDALSVRDSPKVAPNGDPARYKHYKGLTDKYLAAEGAPWRAVAPDPPEPR